MKIIRRFLPLLLITAALLLVFSCAALADHPTDPTMERILQRPWEDVIAAGSPLRIEYDEFKGTLQFDTDYTFTARVSGGTAPYTYVFYLMFLEDDPLHGDNNVYDLDIVQDESDNPSFTFRFSIPYQQYAVFCMVFDADGYQQQVIVPFDTPGPDAAHPDYKERLRSIVAKCPETGDFEKALWLYDYVLDLGDYDYTYTYHGPSGFLDHHTGVCDTYSKLYRDLLLTAGIRAGRVTGGNHAWNTIELDGQWYMCDPTWDDEEMPFHHSYFGLTESLMALDHRIADYEQYNVSCVSMDHNYYVYLGKIDELLGREARDRDWNEMSKPIDVIHDEMTGNGTAGFTLELPYLIGTANGQLFYSGQTRQYYIAAAALHNRAYTYNGREYRVDVIYNKGAWQYRVSIADITDGGLLTLPENVTAINDAVFSGTAACELLITGEVSFISGSAFDNSALSIITLIGDEASIPYTEITANDHIAIRCNKTNPAYDYALENGLAVFEMK